MNRTNNQKSILPAEHERNIILSDIAKDITSIEEEGFGRVVIEVKSGKIVNWWKVASRTRRGFLKKIDDSFGASVL
jgi:hypothetical protein